MKPSIPLTLLAPLVFALSASAQNPQPQQQGRSAGGEIGSGTGDIAKATGKLIAKPSHHSRKNETPGTPPPESPR
jgi:hypothetical protein